MRRNTNLDKAVASLVLIIRYRPNHCFDDIEAGARVAGHLLEVGFSAHTALEGAGVIINGRVAERSRAVHNG